MAQACLALELQAHLHPFCMVAVFIRQARWTTTRITEAHSLNP